jgi:hypothetical protein
MSGRTLKSPRLTHRFVFCGVPPPASIGTSCCTWPNTGMLDGREVQSGPVPSVTSPRVRIGPLIGVPSEYTEKKFCISAEEAAISCSVGTQVSS